MPTHNACLAHGTFQGPPVMPWLRVACQGIIQGSFRGPSTPLPSSTPHCLSQSKRLWRHVLDWCSMQCLHCLPCRDADANTELVRLQAEPTSGLICQESIHGQPCVLLASTVSCCPLHKRLLRAQMLGGDQVLSPCCPPCNKVDQGSHRLPVDGASAACPAGGC